MDKCQIDIKENFLYHLDQDLLAILLRDRSSGKNIIWARTTTLIEAKGFKGMITLSSQPSRGITVMLLSHAQKSRRRSRLTVSSKKPRSLRLLGYAINRIILQTLHGSALMVFSMMNFSVCKTFLLLLIQQLQRRPVLTFAKTFSFHQYHTGGDPVCSLPANFFIFSFTTTTVGGCRFAKRATKKQQIFSDLLLRVPL